MDELAIHSKIFSDDMQYNELFWGWLLKINNSKVIAFIFEE